MGTKASEKTKTARMNKELRRCRRALRHAKARGASEYRLKRIQHHMDAVKAGKKPQALPERVRYREEGRRAQRAPVRSPVPAKEEPATIGSLA